MTAALIGLALAAPVLATTAAWARRRWLIVTIAGESMLPTLTPGQRVRVRRRPPAAVKVGDVVLAEAPPRRSSLPLPPQSRIIKRVAAGPGDPTPDGRGCVPPGMYVLLGDNRAASFDSRHFGYLPAARILGVVSGQ